MKNRSILDFVVKGRKSHKPTSSSSPLSQSVEVEHPSQTQELNQNEQHETDPSPTPPQVGNPGFMPSQEEQVDVDLLLHDPGKRKPISSYPVNDQDVIRRGFIDKKPCRPKPKPDFPQTLHGKKLRRFKAHWYDKYDWLEYVAERFLGVVKVADTSSKTLMATIKKLLDNHSLSMSNIRGQGYDGASNMRGALNGLRNLIMRNNPCAYYVHCFAHQLQLTLVAVAKENCECAKFFMHLGIVLNFIASSCKRMTMLKKVQAGKMLKALHLGEVETGRGLNQEIGLSRSGDTRWSL